MAAELSAFNRRIALERIMQDEKWGISNHIPIEWLAILMKQVGQLAEAIAKDLREGKDYTPSAPVEHGLIQVGAVAKAMYECGERNAWWD